MRKKTPSTRTFIAPFIYTHYPHFVITDLTRWPGQRELQPSVYRALTSRVLRRRDWAVFQTSLFRTYVRQHRPSSFLTCYVASGCYIIFWTRSIGQRTFIPCLGVRWNWVQLLWNMQMYPKDRRGTKYNAPRGTHHPGLSLRWWGIAQSGYRCFTASQYISIVESS